MFGNFYVGLILSALCIAALPASMVLANDETNETTVERPLIEVSMGDLNPNETLKKAIIEAKVAADDSLELSDIDIEKSKIEFNGFDRTQSGLQNVTARVSLSSEKDSKPISYTFIQDVTIKMVKTGAPQLKLKSDSVIVNNGDSFVPTNYIAYINDDSGVLPMLEINEDVNMKKDGVYQVTYTAIDLEGNKTSVNLQVEVKTPQEVIRAREEAERLAREEAERLEAERLAEEERIRQEEEAARLWAEQEAARIAAEEEAARRAAEEAARKAAEETAKDTSKKEDTKKDEAQQEETQEAEVQEEAAPVEEYTPVQGSGYNPYWGGWSNCTWGAWQLAHDYSGAALPNLGNAGEWLGNAQAYGYATGSAPRANSIVVYAGHVGYVDGVSADGTSFHLQEGGYLGGYNQRWSSSATYDILGYIYLP